VYVQVFVGRTHGTIVPATSTTDVSAGFGWDPIFLPHGFTETYAQMPKDIKNKISHRYKAFAQLAEYLGGKAT
jgi:inosine triphosphate pyrophosphatase